MQSSYKRLSCNRGMASKEFSSLISERQANNPHRSLSYLFVVKTSLTPFDSIRSYCQKHERTTPITQLCAIDGLRPKIGLVLPVFRVSDYADDAL